MHHMSEVELTFLNPDGSRVTLAVSTVAVLAKYRQSTSASKEAGGMLLGRIIDSGTDLVIDEATEPTESDQSGRTFFYRCKDPAQPKVNSAWEESRRTRNYLGEWHTHPEDDPQPSEQDLHNWNRISREAKRDYETLVFVIVGRSKMRLWTIRKNMGRVVELDPAESS